MDYARLLASRVYAYVEPALTRLSGELEETKADLDERAPFPKKVVADLYADYRATMSALAMAKELIECLIDNDPDDVIADGGIVVMDQWRKDARSFLHRYGALERQAPTDSLTRDTRPSPIWSLPMLTPEARARLEHWASTEVNVDPKLNLPADYDPTMPVRLSDLRAVLEHIKELEFRLDHMKERAEIMRGHTEAQIRSADTPKAKWYLKATSGLFAEWIALTDFRRAHALIGSEG